MEPQITVGTILFIVSLIVPGVILKRFYFQGQFSKQFGAGLFADRLITSIFWGLVVQILTFLSYSRFRHFTLSEIRGLINNAFKEINANVVPNLPDHYLINVLWYLMATIATAMGLGFLLHVIIRMLKIDIYVEAFRFANEWHYYFTGEILASKEFRLSRRGKVMSTEVDVLIDDGADVKKMVSGFLTKYTLSGKTGDLESIYLTDAQRYSQNSKGFKDIPGDCLIIPYCKVIDMNLRYNIKEVDKNKRRQFGANVVGVVGVILLVADIALPWFLDITLFKKLSGIILLTVSWAALIAVITSPFQEKESDKLSGVAYFITIALFFAFLIAALFVMKIIPLHQVR